MISVVIALVVVTALVSFIVSIKQRRAFNEKFPPIDEDEFIRRCSPGVDRRVALRVRRIVSDSLGVDYDRVYPEQNFVNDLGCD